MTYNRREQHEHITQWPMLSKVNFRRQAAYHPVCAPRSARASSPRLSTDGIYAFIDLLNHPPLEGLCTCFLLLLVRHLLLLAWHLLLVAYCFHELQKAGCISSSVCPEVRSCLITQTLHRWNICLHRPAESPTPRRLMYVLLVTTSKAPVTTSVALVTSSLLFPVTIYI